MTTFRLMLLAALLGAIPAGAAPPAGASSADTQITVSAYEAFVQQVLPCPAPALRETRDFRLCLLIVPPGHRVDEREMLAVFSFRGGVTEMILTMPDVPLWRYANEGKPNGADLKVRTLRTADPKLVTRVAGTSWTKLTAPVVPQLDWFIDATRYQLHGDSFVGSTAVDLFGPGSSARKQPSELLAWAERVRKQAIAILEKQPASPAQPSSLPERPLERH
ncbi:MAG: hypothetical protein M3Q69_06020 [Acidobacteriota bacterium]|nr:hypothetical protein [Acidobacteriota bacterium]